MKTNNSSSVLFFVIYHGVIIGLVLSLTFQPEFLKDYVNGTVLIHNPFDSASAMICYAIVLLGCPMDLLFVSQAFPYVGQEI
jgi:hypothetical protein